MTAQSDSLFTQIFLQGDPEEAFHFIKNNCQRAYRYRHGSFYRFNLVTIWEFFLSVLKRGGSLSGIRLLNTNLCKVGTGWETLGTRASGRTYLQNGIAV